ncbi:hypothetical protein ZIOFF_041025 [Zingiber officinale]|uniref:O-fucosyltransferase family protein n=1 Tax=Zingiber officinale TaxID=94328 RepID=A0A8J5G483_ZINOF|nr:hypothetical protein ZIOFF_041025 [Zingiber officinale]
MATSSRTHRGKQKKPTALLIPLLSVTASVAVAIVWILLSPLVHPPRSPQGREPSRGLDRKYLYWGGRIDCPGKHCDSCAGLGHQESSLRCALEEALFLQRNAELDVPSQETAFGALLINNVVLLKLFSRTHLLGYPKEYASPKSFLNYPKGVLVMPSRMCINPLHNKKGILHQQSNASSDERWAANSCAMDSLYDLDAISSKVEVILDNSKMWSHALSTSMKLGDSGVAHVEGVGKVVLKTSSHFSSVLLINRTANPLAWFMECKDRTNRTSVLLPYSFLPTMAAPKLRDAANKIKGLLGDYDAIHVRRGDKIKTRKDQFGVTRTLHPHLDRDTRPEFIQQRIAKWIPPGRTIFIASNERSPGFFLPLAARYKLAFSSNFSDILDPVIRNNYQLFMVERLVVKAATTYVKTFKEDENDRSLTDDPKKNVKRWQIPVYTMESNRVPEET